MGRLQPIGHEAMVGCGDLRPRSVLWPPLSGQLYGPSNTGLVEPLLEAFHQNFEAEFAGAVPGGHALDLQGLIEDRCNSLNFFGRVENQMKSASDGVEARLNLGGRFEYFLDAGVRAADDDSQSVRG